MVARERHRIESEQGVIVCDTRHLPFVVMQWRGSTDLELLERFRGWIDEFLQALDPEQHVATIVDLTHADPPSPGVRQALARLRNGHQRRSKGRVIVDMIVARSLTQRGMIQALSWINPRAPAVVVATLDEALGRCRTALQRAGVFAPTVTAEEFAEPG